MHPNKDECTDKIVKAHAIQNNRILTKIAENGWVETLNRLATLAYHRRILSHSLDLDIEKCRDLFEIIESRDCRKATIISQIPVSGWYQLFGDSTYADACLSRMTSKAYRLEFPGRDRRITTSN